MTTETVRDPVIEAWSDNLEEGLVEAGMDEASARAYRQAFELGLTRVISQTATRQELQDGLAQVRQELHDGLAQVRAEMKQMGDQLRAEMREMRDQLQREMDLRFGELQKRFNLLTWAIGLGFAGMFGLMTAILVRM